MLLTVEWPKEIYAAFIVITCSLVLHRGCITGEDCHDKLRPGSDLCCREARIARRFSNRQQRLGFRRLVAIPIPHRIEQLQTGLAFQVTWCSAGEHREHASEPRIIVVILSQQPLRKLPCHLDSLGLIEQPQRLKRCAGP